MTTIDNPWFSRPIDIHRISDHPEVAGLIDRLWDEHFRDLSASGRPGPKPKTTFQQQFKALLLDLYVAWKTNPELCIGIPMSSNVWDTNSRYNALRLSRKMVPLIHRARDVGLIDFAGGSYAGPYGPANRNSRIRAAAPLQELFASVSFGLEDIHRHPEQECIVLKTGETLVEYEEDENTQGMRERLRAYNDLLARTFIDIPTLNEPFIDREITTGPDAGQVERVTITADQKFVRRIFSRGRWDLNGRFYGPWWQQINRDWRSQIYIDDKPTVEVDFRGLHVNLLSLEQGVAIEGDPYELRPELIPGVPARVQREMIKKLVLKAINAPTKPSAFNSFRQDWPTGHIAKRMTNNQLSRLLEQFLDRHPQLLGKLCSDQGIRLMYVDSCITDQVLTVATNLNFPVLGIHDSFIIPRGDHETLIQIMDVATRELIGSTLPVEVADDTRTFTRSDGYLARRDKHRQVIPPFLEGCIRRIHAAIFSFCAGVMPPMPMFGRSLL